MIFLSIDLVQIIIEMTGVQVVLLVFLLHLLVHHHYLFMILLKMMKILKTIIVQFVAIQK